MYISILSIGNEIVKGRTVNTNASEISSFFTSMGFRINYVLSCRDIPDDIGKSLEFLLANSDVIITTGGLGPTVDDITISSIASHLGYELTKNEEAFKAIEFKFKKRGLELTPERIKMAMMPVTAGIIKNTVGTAPGMNIRHKGKIIFSIPGVPSEMRSMLPEISNTIGSSGMVYYSIEFQLSGVMESTISPIVKNVMEKHEDALNIKTHPESMNQSIPMITVEIYGFGKNRKELETIAQDMKHEILLELDKINKN